MQIEAPQRLSTAIIQLPTGDSVVEAMVDLQVEPPAVISWDQVRVKELLLGPETFSMLPVQCCTCRPELSLSDVLATLFCLTYADRWDSTHGHTR